MKLGRLLAPAAAALMLGSTVAPASAETAHKDTPFDLQAHRGGIGLTVESTLDAFGRALEIGVSTLELDIQITRDGRDVVTHDRRISAEKCTDTRPAKPRDKQYPYVGKYIKDLTFKQVRTLDCGSKQAPSHPGQELSPGAKMPTLAEVFRLARMHRAHGVRFNIETKVEAGAPHETAPREQFVRRAVREVRRAHVVDRVTIQSFDWGALMRMREVEPRLPLVALTNYDFLQEDQPGASPWLGGIDIDDFDDPIAAIKSFGADAFSPVHGFPQDGTVDDDDYEPYVTAEMVRHAHANGIPVIPWTVNDAPTMHKLIDDGVDGLITDYPNRLRSVMAARGMPLPRPYPAR